VTIVVASKSHRQMAADTLIVGPDWSVDGHAIKIVRGADGSLGGAAGDSSDCCEFLAWVEKGRKGKLKRRLFKGCTGLVLTADGKLLRYEGPVPDDLLGDSQAIGSGTPFASAALSMGCNPEEAVKIAMRHSTACAGDVTVLNLEKHKPARKRKS
jgi:ATP-dependent protease HslVU (ClpYQ) peptidase subunit